LVLAAKESNELNEVVITKRATARINRRDAEVSFVKAAEIQEIPVEGRDITSFFRLPNVPGHRLFPEAPNVSNGAVLYILLI
jgi:hypothetical protein